MMDIQPIQTEYRGYLFRSRLEARWAVFFDAMGIRWEYEPEGIVISDGTFYLPDFYLPDFQCFFEVKHAGLKGTKAGETAVRKMESLDGTWAGMICFGDPMDDDIRIFCQECDDGGGGSYDDPVTIGIHPYSGKPCLLAYDDRREREFFPTWDEEMIPIPMVTTEYGEFTYEQFVTPKVIRARTRARQARFEYGQTPIVRRPYA